MWEKSQQYRATVLFFGGGNKLLDDFLMPNVDPVKGANCHNGFLGSVEFFVIFNYFQIRRISDRIVSANLHAIFLLLLCKVKYSTIFRIF